MVGCAAETASIESRLTPGRLLDDRLLTEGIQKAVADEFRRTQSNVQVLPVVLDGRVFLFGSVASEQDKALVTEIINDFRHVRSVHNELQVGALRNRVTATNDQRIGAQARVALLNDPRTRAEDIKLYTHKGTVYLVGIVPRTVGSTAADLIKHVPGVNSVILLLDYLD